MSSKCTLSLNMRLLFVFALNANYGILRQAQSPAYSQGIFSISAPLSLLATRQVQNLPSIRAVKAHVEDVQLLDFCFIFLSSTSQE